MAIKGQKTALFSFNYNICTMYKNPGGVCAPADDAHGPGFDSLAESDQKTLQVGIHIFPA